jgi:hypothetical protein
VIFGGTVVSTPAGDTWLLSITTDAGLTDAGAVSDAGSGGTIDAGLNDAGAVSDGGASDGGAGDGGGGVIDAGVIDAGLSDDAGPVSDAGAIDAGLNDAGVSDAGASDGGAIDAGSDDAGISVSDAGPSDGDGHRLFRRLRLHVGPRRGGVVRSSSRRAPCPLHARCEWTAPARFTSDNAWLSDRARASVTVESPLLHETLRAWRHASPPRPSSAGLTSDSDTESWRRPHASVVPLQPFGQSTQSTPAG